MTKGSPTRTMIPAELALAAVSVATVASFGRLFEGNDFLLPITIAALIGHALAVATRRRGWGIGLSALSFVVVLPLVIGWIFYLSKTIVGLPSPDALYAFRLDATAAWSNFQNVVAPAPTDTGFLIALTLAIWAASFLADWAAFRLWSAVEAIIPTTALFIFASLLGTDRNRVAITGIFLAALMAFQLFHRVAKQSTSQSWINEDAYRGARTMLGTGAVLIVVALGLSLFIGPRLPGADEAAVFEFRDDGQGPGSRVTLSPMVDIQSRLVEQTDTELFTVESTEPSYWRLTSLDTFDGDIWKSRGDYEDVGSELPQEFETSDEAVIVTQSFQIEALAALWLPAAYEPQSIDTGEIEVVYESASGTLIVGSEYQDSNGAAYVVESALPRFDPEALDAAGTDIPEEIADNYLGLPDGFSPKVERLAAEITAGKETFYDKAIALQNYFRDNYAYDLDIDAGHGIDSMDEFLDVKAGYCEQFAGTYAAMARSLGMPSRVAVGFTPGERDGENPNLYRVTGRQAHAWPEVFIPGSGWVLFEPTPGRGAPGAENYTGVAPQQDVAAAAAPSTPDTTDPELENPTGPTIPDEDAEQAAPAVVTGAEDETGPTSSSGTPLIARVGTILLWIVVAAVAYGALVILALSLQRRRRQERANTGRARVRLAWDTSAEEVALLGAIQRPAETPAEFARRVAGGVAVRDGALDRMASLSVEAQFGPEEPSTELLTEAETIAGQIRDDVAAHTTFGTKLKRWIDPRPLLPRRRVSVIRGDSQPAEARTAPTL